MGGTYQNFTFLLDAGQDNCTEEWDYLFFVDNAVELEFELTQEYCQGDNTVYRFPDETLNGYVGEWDIGEFNPADLTVGSYEFVFTAYTDEVCAYEYVFVIDIVSPALLHFDIPDAFCANADSIFLPDTSIFGVTGIWNNPFIDLNITGQESVIFSANGGCYENYYHTVDVVESLSPSFNIPDSLCDMTELIRLDSSSLEGFVGSWIPDAVVLDTITENLIEFNWYPDSIYTCVIDTSVSILITETITPTFNISEVFCANYGTFVFPDFSDNGIEGSWLISSIETQNLSPGNYTNTFVPSPDFCGDSIQMHFEISELEIPEFTFQNIFCANEDAFELPTESDNGILGSWSISEIDPVLILDSVVIYFTPEDTLCHATSIETIIITENYYPSFSLPEYLCADDENLILPTVSDNNVEGNWNIPEIIIEDFLGESVVLEFIPFENCIESINMIIHVADILFVQGTTASPTNCEAEDGYIQYSGMSNEIEFSIDNGINWNSEGDFNNLASGEYELLYRNTNFPDCIQSVELELVSSEVPNFDQIIANDNTSCELGNGSIELLSVQISELEFSIDSGANWQNSGLFEDLYGGLYTIIVRLIDSPDCTTQINIALDDAVEPIIIAIETEDVSSCNTDNGTVLITVQENVEFSIDGGVSWQYEGLFEALGAGVYDIIVRLNSSEDCIAEDQFEILGIEHPVIDNVIIEDISDCNQNDGQLTILAQGQNLEYSIDNGNSWQSNNIFDDLADGEYQIVIRLSENPDCTDEEVVVVASPILPNIELLTASDPTACNEMNGTIEVASGSMDVEFSINSGVTWQYSGVFSMLPQGIYVIQVRLQNGVSCIAELIVELNNEAELISNIESQIENPSECGSEDGSITFSIISTLDLIYSIDGGQSFQEEADFQNLGAGSYSITIQAENNPLCYGQYDFLIEDPECPCESYELIFSSEPVQCEDEQSGMIELELGNNESVQWDFGSQEEIVFGLTSGWYYLTINYDDDCLHQDSIFIDKIDPLTFSLESFPSDCMASGNGSIQVVEILGGAGPYSYSIDNIDYQSESSFYNLAPDNYQVFVMDLGGCIDQQNILVEIAQELDIVLPSSLQIYEGESIILNSLINEETIDSFYWSVDGQIIDTENLVLELNPQSSASYTLTIYYGECVEKRSILIEVVAEDNIYFPNIFTPDGDGQNDMFFPQVKPNSNITPTVLRIYDRWGNLIFQKDKPELNQINDGWNGRQGIELIAGVYVYQFIYYLNGDENVLHGTVTLIK